MTKEIVQAASHPALANYARTGHPPFRNGKEEKKAWASRRKYSLSEIDLFAAYVIPKDAWYLIPAVLLLGKRSRATAALCPVVPPAKKASYRYECYREAWTLLTRSRAELAQHKVRPSPPSHHRKAGSRRVTKASPLRLN